MQKDADFLYEAQPVFTERSENFSESGARAEGDLNIKCQRLTGEQINTILKVRDAPAGLSSWQKPGRETELLNDLFDCGPDVCSRSLDSRTGLLQWEDLE